MSLNRTNFNLLVDDDGSGATGTIWGKDDIKDVILDPVDAEIARLDAALAALQSTASFSPVLGGDGGTSGQTYTTQVGRFAKVAISASVALIVASGRIVLSAKGTITGNLVLSGLPRPSLNVSGFYQAGVINYFENWTTSVIALGLHVPPNSSFAIITGRASAGTTASTFAGTDVANTSGIIFSVSYLAQP